VHFEREPAYREALSATQLRRVTPILTPGGADAHRSA